ncbi:MAG: nucleotidyl transferase AbiEii/AbiGii toxin family protein, partial [Patescibacteria group bacterium]|nr:nucleotidyl transferase AbiEii/AbiGii toxin family protein [Patescibacteria group bacterium]
INLEIKSTIRGKKTYFELKFPELLFDLKITTNPREKLMIKVDYADFWKDQKPEAILFNRYGFLEMIPALSLNQAVVEKLTAYVSRKQTQGRDIYDVVWLFSQGAKIDTMFLTKNKMKDLVKKAIVKWQKEGNKKIFSRRLAPFLFDAGEVRKLEMFGEVLKKLV